MAVQFNPAVDARLARFKAKTGRYLAGSVVAQFACFNIYIVQGQKYVGNFILQIGGGVFQFDAVDFKGDIAEAACGQKQIIEVRAAILVANDIGVHSLQCDAFNLQLFEQERPPRDIQPGIFDGSKTL